MTSGFAPGLCATIIAVTLWGIQLPIAKDAFDTVNLYHMTSVRYVIPALIMVALLSAIEGPRALSYRGALFPAIALGVIGLSGSPVLVFVGMEMSRAEHAAVIVALQPSIAAMALWLVRGLRPANFTLGCIAIAFVGVVLVVTKGHLAFAESRREILGDFLIFVGAACWVVYSLGTPRLHGWSTWRITALTMVPGAVATVLLTFAMVYAGVVVHPTLEQYQSVAWELAYLAIAGVVIAMLAWNFGNRRIGPQNATLLINLMPVATFVYRAIQGYSFAVAEICGALLVVTALAANNLYARSVHRDVA